MDYMTTAFAVFAALASPATPSIAPLALPAAAIINASSEKPAEVQDRDACAMIGEIAANIMKIRQTGTPMSETMTLAGGDPQMAPLMRAMITDAYRVPQYRTEGNRADTIARFRNEVELACYGEMQ